MTTSPAGPLECGLLVRSSRAIRGAGPALAPLTMDPLPTEEIAVTDIVARLLQPIGLHHWPALDLERAEAADEIERLRAEVEQWKQRYEAERRDHEITIAFCDKIISEGD